jgi:hypothetical protein
MTPVPNIVAADSKTLDPQLENPLVRVRRDVGGSLRLNSRRRGNALALMFAELLGNLWWSFLFKVLRVAGGSCGVFDTSNDDVFLLAFWIRYYYHTRFFRLEVGNQKVLKLVTSVYKLRILRGACLCQPRLGTL